MKRVRKPLAFVLACALLEGGVFAMAVAEEPKGPTLKEFETYTQEMFGKMPLVERPAIELELAWSKTADGRDRVSAQYKGNFLQASSFSASEVVEYGWCGGPDDEKENPQGVDLQICCTVSLVDNEDVYQRMEIAFESQQEDELADVAGTTGRGDFCFGYTQEEYALYQLTPQEVEGTWYFWLHRSSALTIEEVCELFLKEGTPSQETQKTGFSIAEELRSPRGSAAKGGVSLAVFETYLKENTRELCDSAGIPFEDARFLWDKTSDGRSMISTRVGGCAVGGLAFFGSDVAECLWMEIPGEGVTDIGERYSVGYAFSAIVEPEYWERLLMVENLYDDALKTEGEDEDGAPCYYTQVGDYTIYITMSEETTVLTFHLHKDATMTYQEAKNLIKEMLKEPFPGSTTE